MNKVAGISEPASELEHLIAELSESGLLVFVFGVGWWTAHLTGATTPVFRGPADRRWWHVELGDDAASWTMDVRADEITGVRFLRRPYPFPSFPGREVLTVQFLGPDRETVLHCYVHELYDGQRNAPGEAGSLASTARTLRQSRRVENRARHPPGPCCLNRHDRTVSAPWLAPGPADRDEPGHRGPRDPMADGIDPVRLRRCG